MSENIMTVLIPKHSASEMDITVMVNGEKVTVPRGVAVDVDTSVALALFESVYANLSHYHGTIETLYSAGDGSDGINSLKLEIPDSLYEYPALLAGYSINNQLISLANAQTTVENKMFGIIDGSISGDVEAPVKLVKSYVFQNCVNLENVDMPQVTEVGDYAFQCCTSLERVNMPKLKTVGDAAFRSCEKAEFVDVSALEKAGASAFQLCKNLGDFYAPNLTEIVEMCFQEAGAKLFHVGASEFDYMQYRGLSAEKAEFPNLTAIQGKPGFNSMTVKEIYAPKLVDMTDGPIISSSVEKITIGLGDIPEYFAPSPYGTNLQYVEVEFGDEPKTTPIAIGDTAFAASTLSAILTTGKPNYAGPEGQTFVHASSIGDSAFASTKKLFMAPILADGGTIGNRAFLGSSVQIITFEGSADIGYQAYQRCTNISNAIKLSGTSRIRREAFSGCSGIRSVTMESGRIEIYAFQGLSSLKTFKAWDISHLELGAISDCSTLEVIDIGTIGEIPSNGTSYSTNSSGEWVEGETSLSGYGLVTRAPALKAFIIRDYIVPEIPSSAADLFENTGISKGTGYIYVHDDLVEKYQAASGWSSYASQIKPLSEYVEG